MDNNDYEKKYKKYKLKLYFLRQKGGNIDYKRLYKESGEVISRINTFLDEFNCVYRDFIRMSKLDSKNINANQRKFIVMFVDYFKIFDKRLSDFFTKHDLSLKGANEISFNKTKFTEYYAYIIEEEKKIDEIKQNLDPKDETKKITTSLDIKQLEKIMDEGMIAIEFIFNECKIFAEKISSRLNENFYYRIVANRGNEKTQKCTVGTIENGFIVVIVQAMTRTKMALAELLKIDQSEKYKNTLNFINGCLDYFQCVQTKWESFEESRVYGKPIKDRIKEYTISPNKQKGGSYKTIDTFCNSMINAFNEFICCGYDFDLFNLFDLPEQVRSQPSQREQFIKNLQNAYKIMYDEYVLFFQKNNLLRGSNRTENKLEENRLTWELNYIRGDAKKSVPSKEFKKKLYLMVELTTIMFREYVKFINNISNNMTKIQIYFIETDRHFKSKSKPTTIKCSNKKNDNIYKFATTNLYELLRNIRDINTYTYLFDNELKQIGEYKKIIDCYMDRLKSQRNEVLLTKITVPKNLYITEP